MCNSKYCMGGPCRKMPYTNLAGFMLGNLYE